MVPIRTRFASLLAVCAAVSVANSSAASVFVPAKTVANSGTSEPPCRNAPYVNALTEPHKRDATAMLSLGADGCLGGGCPMYAINVFENGAIEFVGRAHVTTCRAERTISPEATREIFGLFDRAQFDSLRGFYEPGETGCEQADSVSESIWLARRLDGKTKLVRVNLGCRNAELIERISTLRTAIDRAGNAAMFIRDAPPATDDALRAAVKRQTAAAIRRHVPKLRECDTPKVATGFWVTADESGAAICDEPSDAFAPGPWLSCSCAVLSTWNLGTGANAPSVWVYASPKSFEVFEP